MRIVDLAATWLPALLLIASGFFKLAGMAQIREGMTKLGVVRYLRPLGLMEIVFAMLFVVPATMKLGFILGSCYLAGAIATELSHDSLTVGPFVPLILLWVGAFLRDRSIFM